MKVKSGSEAEALLLPRVKIARQRAHQPLKGVPGLGVLPAEVVQDDASERPFSAFQTLWASCR